MLKKKRKRKNDKKERADERQRKREEREKEKEKKKTQKQTKKQPPKKRKKGQCLMHHNDEDNEVWIQCQVWSHKECAWYGEWDDEELEDEAFFCADCQ